MQLLKHVAGRGNRLTNGQNDKVLRGTYRGIQRVQKPRSAAHNRFILNLSRKACGYASVSWDEFLCIQQFLYHPDQILMTSEGPSPSFLWRCADAFYDMRRTGVNDYL